MGAQPEEERLIIFRSRALQLKLLKLRFIGCGLNSRVILFVQHTLVLPNSKIICGSRGVTVRKNELEAW